MKLVAASLGIFAAGCVTGEDGDGGGGGVVDRITCATNLSITGTHVEGDNGPLPPAEGALSGCRPIGTWQFTVTATGATDLVETDGDPIPACANTAGLLSQYSFRVDFDGTQPIEDRYYAWLYTVVTPADDAEAELKVTSGGGGLCEGDLQVFPTPDGKTTIIMHPTIESDGGDPPQSTGNLIGSGTYEVHTLNTVPELNDD
jgi:hypothetical protein